MNKTLLASAGGMALAAFSLQAAAQSAPADLQAPNAPPRATVTRPGAIPVLPAAPAASPTAPLAGGTTVELQSVALSGNTSIDTARLLAAVGDVRGRRFDVPGLNALAARVTAAYRAAGYVFASAVLPPQDLAGGVLRIDVLEGRYGRIGATSSEAGFAAGAQGFLEHGLQSGQPIENAQLERTLLILDEQPGVRVTPVIRPGVRRGEGDLNVQVARTGYTSGEVAVDNTGARSTGEYRLRGNLSILSPFSFGDRIALNALTTDKGMWLGSVDYDRPLGPSGLRGQVGYAHTSYQLGGEFAALEARGIAKVTQARLSYPVVRSQATNVLAVAVLAHKELRDEYRATGVTRDKRSDVATVGVQFDNRDRLLGGGLTYGALMWSGGKLTLDAASAAADAVSAQTAGGFDKLSLDIARIQQVAGPVSAYLRFSGQWAGGNLDSSEKFNLGGYYGVRAYPLGEGVGDRGWFTQAELRYSFGAVTPYLFHDFGESRANAKPWDATSSARREVAGSGIGVRSLLGAWSVDGTLGWRTDGGPSTTDGGRDRNPRLYFMAGRRF